MKRFFPIACRRTGDGDARGSGLTTIRGLLFSLVALALSGCGSIFDPAPYSPFRDPTVTDAGGASYKDGDILLFESLSDAPAKLFALGLGYAGARDALMRQQLAFDVPAIGLGIASLTSVAFHGAATVSAGLALGGAAIYGGKTYFEPGTKIAAYNDASQAMLCAAAAAATLAEVNSIYGVSASTLEDQLTADIQAAGDLLSGVNPDGTPAAAISSQNKAALLAARDTAQKALADVTAATQILALATVKLQNFAIATISKATTTVVTGVPDPAAVLKTVQAGIVPAASTVATKPQAVPAPNGGVATPGVAGASPSAEPDPATLTTKLNQESVNAELDATSINAGWTSFTACTTTTTS